MEFPTKYGTPKEGPKSGVDLTWTLVCDPLEKGKGIRRGEDKKVQKDVLGGNYLVHEGSGTKRETRLPWVGLGDPQSN